MTDPEITATLHATVPCHACGGSREAPGGGSCWVCQGRGVDHVATQTALLRAILAVVRRWGR
jgi:DnaJ-class molecular chaperone